MKLTVLGSGDAFASGGRFQSGYLLETTRRLILIDAGPTLLAALKRGGIAPDKLDLVLISHLHGDHFAGLAFLILDLLWEHPPRHRLKIAGPRNLEARVHRLFRTLYPHTPLASVSRLIDFVVLEPKRPQRFGSILVDSIRTPHTRRDISLALRVTAENRSLVYSGDTGWTDELISFTTGADLFLCECTYFSTQTDFHLSYQQIAHNQGRFAVNRFILTHLGREVLPRLGQLSHETAYDGLTIDL